MTKSNFIPNPNPNEYKTLFVAERNRRNLSQANMARALGVTAQWLHQVERGQRPSADKLIQIYISAPNSWVKDFCLNMLKRMFPTFPWRST